MIAANGDGAGNGPSAPAPDAASLEGVLDRLDRLEAVEQIRQLASRYAAALDCRDLDLLTSLFVPDVQIGRNAYGREALKRYFNNRLRGRYTETAHLVGNHVIEFVDAEHALGLVYCRAEHDQGRAYTVSQMRYWDEYRRVEGAWLFARRIPMAWYATDVLDRPVGPHKLRWLDQSAQDAIGMQGWPSFAEFFANPEQGDQAYVHTPPERFLRLLRRLSDHT